MKTLRILGFIMIAGFLFSCEKDIEKDQVKQDVVFGITHLDSNELKSDNDDVVICPDDIHPVKAEIDIRDEDGNVVTYYPEVFYLNGELYTQAIRLASGDYTVEKFLILNIDNEPIMATPSEGSTYAVYVEKTVEFEIIVGEFTKVDVPVEVLCFVPGAYMDFGFFWFNIEEIIVRELFFFGDICATGNPWLPEDFAGSDYEDVPGGLQIDMPAIFEIRAYGPDGEELPYSPFSNLGEEDKPLKVWYPDRKQVEDEEFSFELWILIPDCEGGFEYEYFHTFTIVDDGPLSTDPGDDNVVEFVVGDCHYSATDLLLEWPVCPLAFEDGNLIKDTDYTKLAEARWRDFVASPNNWNIGVGSEVGGSGTPAPFGQFTKALKLDGTPNPVSFNYDGVNTVTATLDADGETFTATYNLNIAEADYFELQVRGFNHTNGVMEVDFTDILVNDIPVTGNTPQTGDGAYWHFIGYDFSTPFTVKGNIIITKDENVTPSQEGAKVNITIGKLM